MHIGPKVATCIDAAEHPTGVRGEPMQADTHAIGRRALDSESVRLPLTNPEGGIGCDAMTATRQRFNRRHYHGLTDRNGSLKQSLESGSIDAVVVGEKELHVDLDSRTRFLNPTASS
jgi:hypothetical protein